LNALAGRLDMSKAIVVKGLGKRFRVRRESRMLAKELFSRVFRKANLEEFWALRDIGFEVEGGRSLGIIGENGSGKSTLLKIISGVTVPTVGDVEVNGRVASLLELGAGFHPYLTGRENVFLNCTILGMPRAAIEERFEEIVEFSGIRDFIDAPVMTYSSGMFVRLGFSAAIHSDPAIFVVDEVLAVGDAEFHEKCRRKIRELREAGKTLVFVSHDLGIVGDLCDEVMLLRQGRIFNYGTADKVVSFYIQTVGAKEGIAFIARDPLHMVFNNGKLALFWNGIELTKFSSGYTSILSKDRWHNSTEGFWQVVESSEHRIVAEGRQPGLGDVRYTWEIELENDRTILWTIHMEVIKEALIEDCKISLMLNESYPDWLSEEEEETFEEFRAGDPNWIVMSARTQSSKTLAVRRSVVAGTERPGVLFESLRPGEMVGARVVNTGLSERARVLQFEDLPTRSGGATEPVRYELFRSRVRIIESDAELEEIIAERRRARSLELGRLRAAFDRASLRIYWDGAELTSRHGGFTSVCSGNIWHDSLQAYWRHDKKDERTLVARGKWRRLPIEQIWTVSVADEHTINWEIDLVVEGQIEAEEFDTSLMVTTSYNRWATDYGEGEFPEIRHKDDWEHASGEYKRGIFVSAHSEEERLPSIRMEFKGPREDFICTAVNTGQSLSARALQCLDILGRGRRAVQPGEYRLLDLTIHIGET